MRQVYRDFSSKVFRRRNINVLVDQVARAASSGVALEIATARPVEASTHNTIPASLIHDALAGEERPLHRRGLRLRGFYVTGDLDLSFMQWHGGLALIDCHIDGQVILNYSRPIGEVRLDGSRVKQIRANSATIDGNFFMRDGFVSDQGVYAIGLTVKNSLSTRRSRICGPHDVTTRMAVEIFRGKFGDIFFQHCEINGGVYAAGVTVERNFRVQGSTILSRSAMGWEHTGPEFKGALTLAGSEVKGSIYLSTASTRGNLQIDGAISLSSATCDQLFVHPEVFDTCSIDLDGLAYSRLRGTGNERLLEYLNARDEIPRQAYVHLAQHCRNVGDPTTSRKVLMALEKRQTRKLAALAPARILRELHGTIVGYGYQVSRSIPWLLATIVLAALVVHDGRQFTFAKSTTSDGQLSARVPNWHDSFGITLDNFLPFAAMGVKDSWVVSVTSLDQWPWLTLFLLLKFFAWGLAALVLISFTSAVRK